MPGGGRTAAAAAVLVAGLVPATTAAAADSTVTLSPSRVEATAAKHLRAGPFGLRNTTSLTYRTTLHPVLLGQNRDGGIFVRADAPSARRAAELLDVYGAPQPLAPGQSLSSYVVLRRPARAGNFYGGVVFRNEPIGRAQGSSVRQVLQLAASLYLRPPRRAWRVRPAAAGAIRGEQAAEHDLRLLAPVANRGNVDLPARGRLVVRDERGDRVAGAPLAIERVLPGATVDLAAKPPGTLPAGRYTTEATVRMGSRTVHLRGRFELFGPDELARRDGELTALDAKAVTGKPFDAALRWRNTGNLPWRPAAAVAVRRLSDGAVVARRRVALPAGGGDARLRLPALAKGNYEIAARLLDGRTELDRRSAGVTPTAALGLLDSLQDWLRRSPLVWAGLLVLLLVAVVAVFTRRERRLRRRLAATAR
jgi:hypothetical protein